MEKKQKTKNRPTISLARKVKDEGSSLEVRQKHTSRNIWFHFMSIGVSLFSEAQIIPCSSPPTFQASNTEILKCIYTLPASFTLQFNKALLKRLLKKYEQYFSGTKQIKLSDFISETLSYLRNLRLTGHTNN